MNCYEFAKKYFGRYKQSGNEILPEHCPYCGGGQKGDKYTFALNVDKQTFNCKRATCAHTGTFWKLCNDFGEIADSSKNFEMPSQEAKTFTPPKTKFVNPTESAIKYLKGRGISIETMKKRNISESRGNIVFPYHEDGQLVLLKFRKPEEYTGEGQKAWREKGGKAVFWGMDNCEFDAPLVVVEGEIDALSLDEAGVPNVVSVPSGAEDLGCVDNCWDWLQKFHTVIIWPDNDSPGQEMCRKLINKIGAWRCWVVSVKHKDANEMLSAEGKEAVFKAVMNAKEVPITGLLRLSEVEPFDIDSAVRVKSSIRGINNIVGGYMMGQVSIWTGINSSGKSTYLGQELLEALDQGFAVCSYSGELPNAVFRKWVDMKAAGPGNIAAKYDYFREEEVYFPQKKAKEKIRKWYRNKFFIVDSFGSATDENLIELFEYAAKRYDCKVFLIDSLMTAITAKKDDYYRRQSEFVGQVKDFSHKHDVHVHIVAHPRKTEGRLTKMDIAGSGDITNRADNVFGVYRVPEDEKMEAGCDNIIDIFKNSNTGKQGMGIALNFHSPTGRFYQESDSNQLYKSYGWEDIFEESE